MLILTTSENGWKRSRGTTMRKPTSQPIVETRMLTAARTTLHEVPAPKAPYRGERRPKFERSVEKWLLSKKAKH